MKWFRHESAARSNPKLSRLRAKFGAEGYGVYWYIVECVSERWEECASGLHIGFSADYLAGELRLDCGRIEEIMGWMAKSAGLLEKRGNQFFCDSINDHIGDAQKRSLRKSVVGHGTDMVRSVSVLGTASAGQERESRERERERESGANGVRFTCERFEDQEES